LTLGRTPDKLAFIVSGDVKNPKFWAKVGVSVLVFAVSFVAFDRLLFTIVRGSAAHYYASMPKGAYKYTDSYGKGDGELLIFGSSRANMALSRQVLSSRLKKRIITEAEQGKYPRYFKYFYQKYRQSFRKPKAVLYGLDYFMFGWKSQPAQIARLGQDLAPETMDLALAADNRSSLLSRISWLYRKKPELDSYMIDLLRLERESGLEKKADQPPAQKSDHGQTAERDLSQGRLDRMVKPDKWATIKYRPFPGREGADFEDLLTTLERENVLVILIFIPDYIGTNETNFEQNKFKSDFQALSARHRGVFVLDFNRPDRFDLNNPELFSSGGWGSSNSHLSAEGRMILTRRLVPEVRKILDGAERTELAERKRAR
jgi:hypothetical protein